MSFPQARAPNGLQWAAYVRTVKPTVDSNGLVNGAWGEFMHAAVAEEIRPDWQARYGEGPAGQVIDFAVQQGHGGFVDAFERLEEQTKQKMNTGDSSYAFNPSSGPVAQGHVIPHHPGAPGTGDTPFVVGVPLTQRLQQAQHSGALPEGTSEDQASKGAKLMDESPMLPNSRPYRDWPFAIGFFVVVLVMAVVSFSFLKEIPMMVERQGTKWESFPEAKCSLTSVISTFPTGENTQVEGINQRLSEPADGRLLSALLWAGGPLHADLVDTPVLALPGLSGFVRRLEIMGLSDPADVEYDLDQEDPRDVDSARDYPEVAEAEAGPATRRLYESRRRRATSTQKEKAPQDQDCERACAAFEECGAFEVSHSGADSSTANCTYYKSMKDYPDPVNATGKVACWRKVDEAAIISSANSVVGQLAGATILAAVVSMLVAVCFVKFSAVQPAAATYVGVYFVPGCMIAAGLIIMVALFPFLGMLAFLVGAVCFCCGVGCMACFCFCYKDLIPLTIAVVGTVATITMRNVSMFCISLCGTVLGLVWSFICSLATIGVFAYYNRQDVLVPASRIEPTSQYIAYPVYFLESFAYFWGWYVVYNVCHCAFCGVFGRWYFGKTESVSESLRVASTTSFGSVCFGSFVIAFIRALEKLARKMKNDAEDSGNMVGMALGCVLECVIGCIGDIIEWISGYVYVQVALRGLGFIDSTRITYALASVSHLVGVVAVILVEYVALLGALMCALIGAGVAGAFGYSTCGVAGYCAIMAAICALFGCCGGCMAGGSAVGIINSGATAIIMCWAEQPDILTKTNADIASQFQSGADRARGLQ